MKRFGYFLTLVGSALVLAAAAPLASMSRAPAEPGAVAALALYRVDAGDRFASQLQFDIARAEYSAAAALTRAQGIVPVEAIRRIANAFYYESRYAESAHALDGLAAEAAAAGDTETQVWALADAAWIDDLSGSADLEGRLAALEELFAEGLLPADVTESIKAKLREQLPVYAPHLSTW